MAKAEGLTQNAVLRIWRAFGLKPHLEQTFKLSTDPFFVEKVRDYARNHHSCETVVISAQIESDLIDLPPDEVTVEVCRVWRSRVEAVETQQQNSLVDCLDAVLLHRHQLHQPAKLLCTVADDYGAVPPFAY